MKKEKEKTLAKHGKTMQFYAILTKLSLKKNFKASFEPDFGT